MDRMTKFCGACGHSFTGFEEADGTILRVRIKPVHFRAMGTVKGYTAYACNPVCVAAIKKDEAEANAHIAEYIS